MPMTDSTTSYILANFGGPRTLDEVSSFLTELLTDQDVVRTGMPQFFHNLIFGRIARKRAKKVSKEYESMGGKSPIYEDTEQVGQRLQELLKCPVIPFHRYLPSTHKEFIQALQKNSASRLLVFPMFPQFTYATSGSIARWFQKKLSQETLNKIRWVKSYPEHQAFTRSYVHCIQELLFEKQLSEEDVFIVFTAHGIPQKFVDKGDVYQSECEASFRRLMQCFPKAKGILSYQSKFGPGEWLRPYTIDVSEQIKEHSQGRQHVLFVPISFTSDHIETLVEIENDYVQAVRKQEFNAYRVPALNLRVEWLEGICEIIQDANLCNNQMLIRHC